MFTFPSILAVGLAALGGSPSELPDIDRPPVLLAAQLRAATMGELDALRLAKLCADPAVLPYLRRHVEKQKAGTGLPGLRASKLALANHFLTFTEAWAKERRVDLLMEAAITVAPLDEVSAVKVVNRMHEVLRPLRVALQPLPNGKRGYPLSLAPLKERKVWTGSFHHGDRITVTWQRSLALFGREVATDDNDQGGIVCASAGITRKAPAGNCNWDGLFVCGGDVATGGILNSVVIADGDIVLPDADICGGSLLIATGNIVGRGNVSATDCHLYAGGDIRTGGTIRSPGSVLRAGGKVVCTNTDADKIANHVGGFDFGSVGLRFFKLDEVGLELGGVPTAISVKAVAEKSPFRTFFRPGDVLGEINGRRVVTADDARRAIREATVWEYATVTLKRDGKELKRLVHLPAAVSAKK